MQSGQFLQSKEWAEFQKSLNRKIFFIEKNLVIKMPFPLRLSYLYCPKGPDTISNDFINEIKKIAKKERAIFLRAEPPVMPPKDFVKTGDVQPAGTLITDISVPPNDLLAAMHPKTRYNIRLAERKGVKTSLQLTTYNLQLFDDFYHLLQLTAKRQNIKIHPQEYYKKLAAFNKIFIAYHEDKPVATAMINFYNDTATYLHGGSDERYKNLMAPYLLHWEIIKYAGDKGCKFYDWWGADEKKWPGVTRFKIGFGGTLISAPGTFDLPINKFLYKIYRLIKR